MESIYVPYPQFIFHTFLSGSLFKKKKRKLNPTSVSFMSQKLIGSNLDTSGKNVNNNVLRITTVSVTVSVSVR